MGINRISLGVQIVPAAPARDARPAGHAAAGRPRAVGHSPRCRFRQHLARPHLRDPRPERRRPRARPRRGPRARAGAPLLLRARGEAGHALHARARGRARAPGGGAGGLLRARRRDADRRRLPLVRDRQLLPARSGRGAGGICAHVTTSATGRRATTSASASARSPQSAARAGGTRRARRATSTHSGGRRPQRERRGARPPDAAERAGAARPPPRRAARAAGLDGALDADGLERVERLGLAVRRREGAAETVARRRAVGCSAAGSPPSSSPSARPGFPCTAG